MNRDHEQGRGRRQPDRLVGGELGEASTGLGAGCGTAVTVVRVNSRMSARTGNAHNSIGGVGVPVVERRDLEDVGDENQLPDGEQEGL